MYADRFLPSHCSSHALFRMNSRAVIEGIVSVQTRGQSERQRCLLEHRPHVHKKSFVLIFLKRAILVRFAMSGFSGSLSRSRWSDLRHHRTNNLHGVSIGQLNDHRELHPPAILIRNNQRVGYVLGSELSS